MTFEEIAEEIVKQWAGNGAKIVPDLLRKYALDIWFARVDETANKVHTISGNWATIPVVSIMPPPIYGDAFVKASENRVYGEFSQVVGHVHSEPKCECGAHKLGVKNHSSWCPLHGKE
jgi:hypothetical protein